MAKEVVYQSCREAPDKKGIYMIVCELCQKPCWHYREAGDSQVPRCMNHSVYNGKKHHVPDLVQLGNMKSKPDAEPMTERELRNVNRMDTRLWNKTVGEREVRVRTVLDAGEMELFQTGEPVTTRNPLTIICTFCKTEIQMINTLTEKKPKIRYATEPYIDSDGNPQIKEVIVRTAETIHACQKCSLQIRKPIIVRTV